MVVKTCSGGEFVVVVVAVWAGVVAVGDQRRVGFVGRVRQMWWWCFVSYIQHQMSCLSAGIVVIMVEFEGVAGVVGVVGIAVIVVVADLIVVKVTKFGVVIDPFVLIQKIVNYQGRCYFVIQMVGRGRGLEDLRLGKDVGGFV